MRILCVGYHNPHFDTMTECIERAIVALGHELRIFDYRAWKIPGRIRDRVPSLHDWDLRSMNNGLVAMAMEFNPDLVLVTGGYTISGKTIQTIKQRLPHCKTVNWIADFPLKFNEYCENGPSYDHFFASGTEAVEYYRACGNTNGAWMPFACDPQVHRFESLSADDRARFSCDIAFVGGNYTERRELLGELCDLDLGIWGIGWERLPAGSPLRRKIRGSMVDVHEWTRIYNAGKISLNIIGHRCDVVEPYFPEEAFRMTNTKVFEILSCGGFQMVDAKADVLSLFEDKKHLVVYHSAKELRELIAYYLHHPEERERIRKSGMQEARQRHTYHHRIREILATAFPKQRAELLKQGSAETVKPGKLLFSGYHNPNFLTVTEYIENAFRSSGYELSIFDPHLKLFPSRLHSLFPVLLNFDRYHAMTRLLSMARAARPAAAIFSGGFDISAEALRTLSEMDIPTVLWTTDAPNDLFGQLIATAPLFSHIFCQGTEAVELFAKAGITNARWLPMACDPQIHTAAAPPAGDVAHDVVFVGSYYPNRWTVLKQLTSFNTGIYGPHWDTVRSEWPPELTIRSNSLRPNEWLSLFRAAKIVVVVHYQSEKYPCYQASPKIFEALAAGCFVLVDRQRDVFDLYTDNEHVAGFDDAADLRKKIAWYLRHDEERNRIAEAGRKFTLENHTYTHRVNVLLSFLEKSSGGRL